MLSRNQRCVSAAKRCGNWLIKNQILNKASADHGRYMCEYIVPKQKVRGLSPNWPIGNSILSMVMLYKRTGMKKYLESAGRAGEYLKSLQVMDSADKKNYGMIREVTPQTDFCHPRDAVTAAWAMLHLGEVLQNKEYGRRVLSVSQWFKK